jgi:hypothetical protein
MEAIALPASLKRLEGRITDVDSHEMIPAQEWVRLFGPDVQAFADAWIGRDENELNDKKIRAYPTIPVTSCQSDRTLVPSKAPAHLVPRTLPGDWM